LPERSENKGFTQIDPERKRAFLSVFQTLAGKDAGVPKSIFDTKIIPVKRFGTCKNERRFAVRAARLHTLQWLVLNYCGKQ